MSFRGDCASASLKPGVVRVVFVVVFAFRGDCASASLKRGIAHRLCGAGPAFRGDCASASLKRPLATAAYRTPVLPRRLSLGLIEAAYIANCSVSLQSFRGDCASASLKPLTQDRLHLLYVAFRGDCASASLKLLGLALGQLQSRPSEAIAPRPH